MISPNKIKFSVLVTTEQGRCLELEYWKIPKDKVLLKRSHAGFQWMFQDEYNHADVEKYALDPDGNPEIGYNFAAYNGGYLGEYKTFAEFKHLVEFYMGDWILEIFDFNSDDKSLILTHLVNEFVRRVLEYGNSISYSWKYHSKRPKDDACKNWFRTRIDYLVTHKFKLQKDQCKKLMDICLDFALKFDDEWFLALGSFFENTVFGYGPYKAAK